MDLRGCLAPTRAKVLMAFCLLIAPFAATLLVIVLLPLVGFPLGAIFIGATFVLIESLPGAPFLFALTITVLVITAYALGCYWDKTGRAKALVFFIIFLLSFFVITECAEQVYAHTTARGCTMPGDVCTVDCHYGPVNYRWSLFNVFYAWGSGLCKEQEMYDAVCLQGRCTLVATDKESNA